MLTCPVCRSQNMDTAKFCGNCGNPFPRPSMPTSSLINCPQGHVYSAIYQYCPYCPQPESASSPDSQNDFATRIEEPATAFEAPNSFHVVSPSASTTISASAPTGDFSTNAEPFVGNFETRIGSFEPVENPQAFETRISGIEISEVIEQKAVAKNQTPAATEVISHFAETTIAEMPAVDFEPPPPPIVPPPPIMAQTSQAATIVSADPKLPKPDDYNPLPKFAAADDRRTIIVADDAAPQRSSKGLLVGWLVSYANNPDGEDYRIYSGYNRMGANPVCDIVLEDETVSGSHAIIVYREGRFLIKDDLSRNGTYVNGREINEAHPLQSYDQVRLGNSVMT
ncbi:MAG: FHA domain-containing protein, partial [Acidobacteriota bacterium]